MPGALEAPCNDSRHYGIFAHTLLGRSTMIMRIALLALLIPCIALADPNGKTGRTSTITQGCADCHGSNAGNATSISLKGPQTVGAGQMATFTIVIGHASNPSAGVSVAIRQSPTGTSDGIGVLSTITGAGLRVRGMGGTQELTQSAPKLMSNKQAEFAFTWTAPTTPGKYYVQAVANAVNGNGRNDAGDDWTFLEPVEIVVESNTSVLEDVAGLSSIFPNPCATGEILNIGTEINGVSHVQLVNASGQIVLDEMMDITNGALPKPLAGLPRGVYFIVVRNEGTTRRGSIQLW
ncbi:MAG: T9SS type A sorting domain-containing protein [Ignavibacteria bacterium]|nr:T9SS type A sorting domain-containing protein [Ignavibacteria bacterium]